jgi:mRNA interferase RelE/StbE
MNIAYARGVEKDLAKLGYEVHRRILEKIEAYAANPRAFASQVKRLKGSPLLRLRVGDYRVLFTEDGLVLTIFKVGHRREIYE